MQTTLNPESPIPLYRQLAELLMAKINGGEYPPGSRIPSEHNLAAQYGIGRPTARQATEWLVRRRVLVRKRGSGTYVRGRPEEIDLFSLAGTLSAFEKKGISVHSEIHRRTRLVEVGNENGNPFAGERAYCFSRVSRVDNAPVLLEEFYLDAELFHGIDQINLEGRSLSRIVEERYFMRPEGGRQSFRIGYLTGERADIMEISPKTPILAVKRYLNFPRAKGAIYSELFCRTERFSFSQTLGNIA